MYVCVIFRVAAYYACLHGMFAGFSSGCILHGSVAVDCECMFAGFFEWLHTMRVCLACLLDFRVAAYSTGAWLFDYDLRVRLKCGLDDRPTWDPGGISHPEREQPSKVCSSAAYWSDGVGSFCSASSLGSGRGSRPYQKFFRRLHHRDKDDSRRCVSVRKRGEY